jgi:quercetin dioxygenase-like cupin family protein
VVQTETEVAVDSDASANPAGPSRPKGQRMLTWDEPGEWIVDPVKRLRHCAVRLGVDERGAATMMLIVKYDPGSRVEPHYHHSDYASIASSRAQLRCLAQRRHRRCQRGHATSEWCV